MGWIPYAGDWDADGHDDIGVFDPLTATYHLYVQDPPMQPGALSAPGFTRLAAYTVSDSGPGGLPVAGDWNTDPGDQVGLYLPLEQEVLLLAAEGGEVASVGFPAPAASDWLPVAGDWGGQGEMPSAVGLYSPSQRVLLVSQHNSLNPARRDYLDETVGMLPVVGDWGLGESIGFYIPATEAEFGSFVVYPCDFALDQCGGRLPLPIGPPPADPPLADGCPLRRVVYAQ
jgi:hypothetical protein